MRFPQIAPLVPFLEATRDIPIDDFVSIDGQSVYVRESGSGPTLCLLHGFASTSGSFRELFDGLSGEFRLLGIDLNGFGKTQRPRHRDAYRLESQADLIAQVLAAKQVDKAILIGHSYGAAVTASLCERHPDLVSKVVLISPPSHFGGKPPWYLRNWLGPQIAYGAVRGLLSNPKRFKEVSGRAVHVEGILTNELSERYRKSMLVEGFRDAFFGYAKALSSGSEKAIPYQSIIQQAMIISGHCDEIVTIEDLKKVSSRIPSARFESISECGHCPPEERPQEVIRLLRDFLTA